MYIKYVNVTYLPHVIYYLCYLKILKVYLKIRVIGHDFDFLHMVLISILILFV